MVFSSQFIHNEAETIEERNSLTLVSPLSIQIVHKMTEKFSRDFSIAANLNVAKRSYYLAEGRIRTLFHYAESDVTRASKVSRLLAGERFGSTVMETLSSK